MKNRRLFAYLTLVFILVYVGFVFYSAFGNNSTSLTGNAVSANFRGYIDAVNNNKIPGWACDANNPNEKLAIHFYFDRTADGNSDVIVLANFSGESAIGSLCGGNSQHRFVADVPEEFKDGKTHKIYAYGVKYTTTGEVFTLTGSPMSYCFGSDYCNLPSVDYLGNQLSGSSADSFVFKENGVYYLYFTGGNNIPIYKSDNFIDWSYVGKTFVSDYINVLGKKKWEDITQTANYDYTDMWDPKVVKRGNYYVLIFSAKQVPIGSEISGYSGVDQTKWMAFSTSPEGPFGPNPQTNTRMHEPVPIRNPTGSVGSIPHSNILANNYDIYSMRLGGGFLEENGELWFVYDWFGSGTDSGTHIGAVKLNITDITFTTKTAPAHIRLTNSRNIIYDSNTGKEMKMCYGTNTPPGTTTNPWCVNEGAQIYKINNKYYLFYSGNYFNSNAYSVYYKMANSFRCLELGKENDASCGVKKGIFLDGTNATRDYNYGWGTIVEGPNNKQYYIFTVMKKSENPKSYRKLWVTELEFNTDLTPKTKAPDIIDKVNINSVQNPEPDPTLQTCTSFTYSAWSPATCPSSQQQTRTILTSSPSGCINGNPESLTQICVYVAPCTEANWQYSISPATCPSTSQQIKTWTKIGTCSGGINHTTETLSCTYNAPICSYTYSSWIICQSSGTQTRTVLTSSPSGCQGTPITSQSCNYIPPCIESDWSFFISPTTCPSTSQQTKTWTKIGTCSGGINHTTETISCTYNAPQCVYAYSGWGACSSSGTQTQTVIFSSPSGCQGTPITSQSCNYIPPCLANDWTSSISPATCPSTSQQTKTWTLVGNCNKTITNSINHPTTEIISCIYVPNSVACTGFSYSVWGECLSSNSQTRTISSSSPTGCVGGNPVTSQSCNYIPPCLANDWTSSISPATCPVSGNQTKTWSLIGTCNRTSGINKPLTESVSCTYVPNSVACINFGYSDWGECLQSNVQTRTISSSSPTGCVGGNPVTSQECAYVSPVPNDAGNTGTSSGGGGGGSSSSGSTSSSSGTNTGTANENANTNSDTLILSAPDEKPGVVKTFFIKLICRLSNLFNGEKYTECVLEYVGA